MPSSTHKSRLLAHKKSAGPSRSNPKKSSRARVKATGANVKTKSKAAATTGSAVASAATGSDAKTIASTATVPPTVFGTAPFTTSVTAANDAYIGYDGKSGRFIGSIPVKPLARLLRRSRQGLYLLCSFLAGAMGPHIPGVGAALPFAQATPVEWLAPAPQSSAPQPVDPRVRLAPPALRKGPAAGAAHTLA